MPLRRYLPMLIIGLLVMTSTGGALAQVKGPGAPAALAGAGFTYQGELRNGGSPVTAACDFQFSLYDALSAGTQVGATQTLTGVSVVGGRFTVTLNAGGEFGARAFDGSARWLAVAVKCPPDSGFTALIPRQPLTAAPLALALPGLRTEPNATSPNMIGGSISNTVSAGVVGATIGGGGNATDFNSIGSSADYATVGGGISNTASGGFGATVGGGIYNNANGAYATVPGGIHNMANGQNSFAGGIYARAVTDGSFVWSGCDLFCDPITSTVTNEFLVRASGGISLTTNSSITVGCNLGPGGGTWNCTSDRNSKANFASVDGLQVLNALAGIPIQTWNFKTQDAAIRHIGPMAQDFHAAFGVGENDTTISTVDAQGVALAAIQGLYQLVQEQNKHITALQQQSVAQQQVNAELQARLGALDQKVNGGAPLSPAGSLPLGWLSFGALFLLNLGGLAGYLLARRAHKPVGQP